MAAQEWSVPVVGTEWLAEMATTGVVPPVFDFLVLYPAGQGAVAKGKQKAGAAVVMAREDDNWRGATPESQCSASGLLLVCADFC
jgi:hypothetical protein